MIDTDQFCDKLCQLRKVAQNWVREYLHDAEDAAFKGNYNEAAQHCENAMLAAKVSVSELDNFLEKHLGNVMTPQQAAKELYDGNDNFLRRVENAVSAISLLSLELQMTARCQAEA